MKARSVSGIPTYQDLKVFAQLRIMDNGETTLGLQFSSNPHAQCVHRRRISLAKKLPDQVEAGVLGNGDNTLCRCFRRPDANIRQSNPELILSMRDPKPPAVVLL